MSDRIAGLFALLSANKLHALKIDNPKSTFTLRTRENTKRKKRLSSAVREQSKITWSRCDTMKLETGSNMHDSESYADYSAVVGLAWVWSGRRFPQNIFLLSVRRFCYESYLATDKDLSQVPTDFEVYLKRFKFSW